MIVIGWPDKAFDIVVVRHDIALYDSLAEHSAYQAGIDKRFISTVPWHGDILNDNEAILFSLMLA